MALVCGLISIVYTALSKDRPVLLLKIQGKYGEAMEDTISTAEWETVYGGLWTLWLALEPPRCDDWLRDVSQWTVSEEAHMEHTQKDEKLEDDLRASEAMLEVLWNPT
ncbi:hypothetical protein NDU88_009382 [Pleurodeles waltl]|uniref:Uncharacterized protein n=1 Tax=Pleurodeles waltl TaxID=8319 RepID=A0AAV7QSV9_PLEWA|nr:hypothetical protein NDU88_009382 [Pleurodeles waltl]